jgi:PKHD-type hydroxylase
MILQISELLSGDRLISLRDDLARENETFVSGKLTAGWSAKAVKNNDQSAGPAAKVAMEEVRDNLLSNTIFKSAARPKDIMGMLVSRYRQGMAYGSHVDEAIMKGARTDLSFTVFLTNPEDYDGGELVVEDNDGDNMIKLAAGSVVVYPSTSLHHVAEVTRGERLVVVGWVRSFIRHAEQREMLFDLDQTIAALKGADRSILNRVFKIRNNLLRMWVED